MRKFTLLLALSGALLAASAVAHPEDDFGGNERRGPSTAELAGQAINDLIVQKKLPASWAKATLANFDFRTKNGADQYVLTYENMVIKHPAKRKLYVLMTTSGKFISAGYRLS